MEGRDQQQDQLTDRQRFWPVSKEKSTEVRCFEVGMTGFEPAASSSRTKRATGLRYIPYWACKGKKSQINLQIDSKSRFFRQANDTMIVGQSGGSIFREQ